MRYLTGRDKALFGAMGTLVACGLGVMGAGAVHVAHADPVWMAGPRTVLGEAPAAGVGPVVSPAVHAAAGVVTPVIVESASAGDGGPAGLVLSGGAGLSPSGVPLPMPYPGRTLPGDGGAAASMPPGGVDIPTAGEETAAGEETGVTGDAGDTAAGETGGGGVPVGDPQATGGEGQGSDDGGQAPGGGLPQGGQPSGGWQTPDGGGAPGGNGGAPGGSGGAPDAGDPIGGGTTQDGTVTDAGDTSGSADPGAGQASEGQPQITLEPPPVPVPTTEPVTGIPGPAAG
jgi:integrin beta 8